MAREDGDGSAALDAPRSWPAAMVQGAVNLVGATLFLLVFAGFCVQVFTRYVLNDPQSWTDELIVVLFVWSVCWTAALMTPFREHVTLDFLVEAVGPGWRRAMSIVAMAALAVLFSAAVSASWDMAVFMHRKRTPVLDIPMSVVFGPFVIFLVGFAARAVWSALRQLLRP